ncbi:MAG: hypothetical protein ABIX01_03810, partial [Chitinophagaceae bacterium]
YTVPCNVPIGINASYICAQSSCMDTVTYALTTPAGVTTTGNVPFIFNPTQSGIYTLKLYGHCGSKICDSCTIRFKVDCCNCAQSQWEYVSVKYGTLPTQQISCNQQYTASCNVPITIGALFLCGNNTCNGPVQYKLTTPGGVTTTGNVAFSFNPTQTGIYSVTLYGYCGTKICDSCTVRFKVDCCDCAQSQWEFINMKSGTSTVTTPLSCNKQYTVPCNVPITLSALYLCSNSTCTGVAGYKLTTPGGVTTTGNLALSFNPTQTGIYTLTLYGYCGSKICDSCKITFKVDCCNCNNSQWGDIIMKSGTPTVSKTLSCNGQYSVPCNVPVNISAYYLCTQSSCTDTVTYALTTPAGVTTTGNTDFTFNPTLSGTYTVKLYGYCGSKICDSCKITFIASCPPVCNCNGSRWGDIWINYGNPPATRVLKCNRQYNLPCNVPVSVNANYFCNSTVCPGIVKYTLTTPAGTSTDGNVPFTFTPVQNGTYTLVLYGYCGAQLCDECRITFTVNCGFFTMVSSTTKLRKPSLE